MLPRERELARAVDAARDPGQGQGLGAQLRPTGRGDRIGRRAHIQRHLPLDVHIRPQPSGRRGQLRVLGVEHECGAIRLRVELRLEGYRHHAGRGGQLEPDVADRDPLRQARQRRPPGRLVRSCRCEIHALQAQAALVDAAAHCEPLDAHRLNTATQEVARPIIDAQPADPLLRARPAAEREARQLEPVQADPKVIEGNFLVARHAQPGAQQHGRSPRQHAAEQHEQQDDRQQRGE